MTDQLPPVRRLVSGDDASGRSSIIDDGPALESSRTVPGRPGYRVTNLWTTLGTPAPIDQPDRVVEHKGIAPPPNGTIIRVIDIPPESPDPEERKRQVSAAFGQMFTDADHRPDQRHPGMHRTDSVDYAIVLMGELVAIMDKDETVMKAGDILIQRGTNHAWANRSGKMCRIAFVLIDGKR
jgi:hypothetical protein